MKDRSTVSLAGRCVEEGVSSVQRRDCSMDMEHAPACGQAAAPLIIQPFPPLCAHASNMLVIGQPPS